MSGDDKNYWNSAGSFSTCVFKLQRLIGSTGLPRVIGKNTKRNKNEASSSYEVALEAMTVICRSFSTCVFKLQRLIGSTGLPAL